MLADGAGEMVRAGARVVAGVLGREARAQVTEAERAAFLTMAEAVQTLAAILAEQPVCGRSYDGRCPMPRPEPADGDHQRQIFADASTPMMREEQPDLRPDDEPCGDPDCYTCGSTRREHEQAQPEPVKVYRYGPTDGDPFSCVVCAHPVDVSKEAHVVERGFAWHWACYFPEHIQRREHEQEQQIGSPPERVCDECRRPIPEVMKSWQCVDGKLRCPACYLAYQPPDCSACGQPIKDVLDRVGKSGGTLGSRFLYFHRACAPEKHPG